MISDSRFRMHLRFALFLLPLVLSASTLKAEAASFPCSKATTPDEVTICRNPQLSQQDEQASAAYSRALRAYSKNYVAPAARGFLVERRACGRDARCISDVQLRTIGHFTSLVDGPDVAPEPRAGTAVGRTVPYGSRAGMDMTIVDASGIGTGRAVIQLQHTRENAKSFCLNYQQTSSESCIRETLADVSPEGMIVADCTTGEFSNLDGVAMTYHAYGDIIVNRDTGEELDGSSASGHPVSLAQYKALCPR